MFASMAKEICEKLTLVMVAFVLLSVQGVATAAGRKNLTDLEIRKQLRRLNKPAIKIIKVVPLVLSYGIFFFTVSNKRNNFLLGDYGFLKFGKSVRYFTFISSCLRSGFAFWFGDLLYTGCSIYLCCSEIARLKLVRLKLLYDRF